MKHLGIILIGFAVLLAGVYAGCRISLGTLKAGILEALGPSGEVREIGVGWSGIHIEGLRIGAKGLWPSADTLRADRVVIVPSIRGLFSDTFRIRSITVDRPYLSIVRTRRGKLLAVPSLLGGRKEETPRQQEPSGNRVHVDRISLRGAEVEFFDETLHSRGNRFRFRDIRADLHDLMIPGLDSRTGFELAGAMEGSRRDATVSISGWVVASSGDSSVGVKLRSLELARIQPYISRKGDVRVKGGTLDLDLRSEVRNHRLKAPGTLVMRDLELSRSEGMFGSFMGMPRDAVLTLLEDEGGRITLDFVLEGDTDNPRFSLNESLSTRLAVSMADTFKLGMGDMAKGAGSLGEKGADAAAGVVKGIEGTVRGLFRGGQ